MLVEEKLASVFIAVFDESSKALNQIPFIGISPHLFLRTDAFGLTPSQRLAAVTRLPLLIHREESARQYIPSRVR